MVSKGVPILRVITVDMVQVSAISNVYASPFFVCAAVDSYLESLLFLYVPHLSFICCVPAVLRYCGISWVLLLICFHLNSRADYAQTS